MSEQQAIEKYIAMGERMSNPTSKRQYWQDRADELALKCKASMAVVKVGDHYQVWPVSKAGSNHEYIAEYVGGNEDA